ncbi:MAG: hypothetical protein IT372_04540 [Polyangiaceae bacterium]|nr:hypothetical protein [Polyangiaceae bacterium]
MTAAAPPPLSPARARGAEVLAIGMVTSVGLGAAGTAAAVRAGIAGFRETAFRDQRDEPIHMGVVPDELLPELTEAVQDRYAFTERQARMLALAGAALAECAEGLTGVDQAPLLLATPEAPAGVPGAEPPLGPGFLEQLALQSGVAFHAARGRIIPEGRAAGILAIEDALRRIASGDDACVLVGGVDSYHDEDLLEALDDDGRLRAPGVFDGFVPGEAAAFLALAAPGVGARRGVRPLATIDAAAAAEEPGHRFSEAPYRGDGLHAAFRALFAAWQGPPVRHVTAGFNGEHLGAKEWGVAYLRHRPRFAEGLRIEHPIDCLGDPGAALAPVLAGLSAIGLARGYKKSPCLVFCSSDRALRGAALLRRIEPPPAGAGS